MLIKYKDALVAIATTCPLAVGAGYWLGTQTCQSLLQKVKDFLF